MPGSPRITTPEPVRAPACAWAQCFFSDASSVLCPPAAHAPSVSALPARPSLCDARSIPDALHRRRRQGIQLESIAHQWLHRIRDHDAPGWGQCRDARGEVGSQPVHVVVRDIEINQTAVDPDANTKFDPEPALGLLA